MRQLITPYYHIAQIRDLKSQYGDPRHPKNAISYIYHCRAIQKFSSKFAHNLLSNGQISTWAVSMVIQITPKINHLFLLPPQTLP